MDAQQKRNIVIVGGGIIGCTTAYYLTRHPKFNPALHTVTLLEASSIAAGASGKAGGLLALWAYPSCLVPLSYRLHRELAAEHGGAQRWGYRRLGCGSLSAVVKASDLAARKDKPPAAPPAPNINGTSDELPIQSTVPDEKVKEWEKLPKQDGQAAGLLKDSPLPSDLDWIDGRLVQHYEEMGEPGATETAQVHPFHFTNAMADLARDKGVDIRLRAKVTKLSDPNKDGMHSVEYEDRDTGKTHMIGGVTDVVVTAGPWTGKLLPRTRVEGLRAHSVVFEADVSPYAVFTDIELPGDYVPAHRAGNGRRHKGNVDPEIYARPFGEVYACGEPDTTTPLPPTADAVSTDPSQCDDLIAYIATVSPQLAAAPVKARQACYLPRHMRFGEQRAPLIGPTSVPGLWVAAGHTCWGIQNGPGTGYLMAGMLFGEEVGAEVGKLDPRRFKV